MNNIRKAYAKINLSLDVVSKRADGYHELKTVMHSVKLFDVIRFEENGLPFSQIKTDSRNIPSNENNIIIKACRMFFEYTNINPVGFDVFLDKTIPVCAGLGGGSSDAAAAVCFLNEYFGFVLNENDLLKLGAKIGADVPFCIKGGTCLCEGIGEIITPLPPLPECFIVIAKPDAKGLSTKHIFSKVDIGKIKYHPDTNGLTAALNRSDLYGISKRVYNVLEDYSAPECPAIGEYERLLDDSGALVSAMSGSGTAVFGIFDRKSNAENAVLKLQQLSKEVYLTV